MIRFCTAKIAQKIHQEIWKSLDKDQAGNCGCSIANGTFNGASQQMLNQGTNVRLIKNSAQYFLIHFLICNFSLPCTPFETIS